VVPVQLFRISPNFLFSVLARGECQGVGRDQHCAAPARLSCDQHVIGADRRAEAFELGADFTGLLGILRLEESRGPCCGVQLFVSGERVEVTSGEEQPAFKVSFFGRGKLG
jgi:hypothetical protein